MIEMTPGDRVEIVTGAGRRAGWCVREPDWILLDGCRRPSRRRALLAYRGRPDTLTDYEAAVARMQPPRRKEWTDDR